MRLPSSHLRLTFAAILIACAGLIASVFAAERKPALPMSADYRAWLATAHSAEIALARRDDTFTLQLKKSHAYPKVLRGGKVIGAFRCETATTSVEGELVTCNLARFLGCPEVVIPTVPFTLKGRGLAAFRDALKREHFSEEDEESDRLQILQTIEDEPKALEGFLKEALPANAAKYTAIEQPHVAPNGALNRADPIARFLDRRAPQPGTELFTPPGFPHAAPMRQLARELSDILLIDALVGQWDRFSGGNLHLVERNGHAHFVAYDNGGAAFEGDHGYLARFKSWVTRFDCPVAARVVALDAFLEKHAPLPGFTDEESLAEALRIDEPVNWQEFKTRLRKVAAHLRAHSGSFFAED